MFDFVLLILIVTLVTIFVFVVAPILTKTMNKKDIEKIRSIISDVVLSVEQTLQDGTGEEKKALAIAYCQRIFEHLEIDVSYEMMESFIEAAVYLLNQGKKKESPFTLPKV